MFNTVKTTIDAAKSIVVIQPENPDADSLGSAIALEELLSEQGKTVTMFCAIDMPKYLRYIPGWDRVENDWNAGHDMAIIVDTSAEALLVKTLEKPTVRHFLETHPVLVFDHHIEANEKGSDLSFPHEIILDETAAATSELLLRIANKLGWKLTSTAADVMLCSILGDTLGLSTPNVTADTMRAVVQLMEHGAHPATVDTRRRKFMRKPADILSYKARLIDKIEYHCDGRLAIVHIPWEEIEEYSDRYNPSVLVLDEMRLVEGVEIAVAIKTYPDGKLTGKIRTNTPVAQTIAGFFGGGGHAYAAGFKIFEEYDKAVSELIQAVDKIEEPERVETL